MTWLKTPGLGPGLARLWWAGLSGAILAVLVSFTLPVKYTSVAAFIADAREPMRGLSGLAGLAAQFNLGSAGGSRSPQFYADVLRSQVVLKAVLDQDVVTLRSNQGVPLRKVLGSRTDTPKEREKVRRHLRRSVSATVNPRTGIIELRVELGDPRLATDVASLLIKELGRFNRETRQLQARERRRFAETRMGEALDSLTAAEDAVRRFSENNRQFQSSPTLELEYERLQRQVAGFQELFTTLRTEFETARLEEVNDTPVITVLDPPTEPVRKSSPNRLLAGLGGMMAGLVVMLLVLSRNVAFVTALRTIVSDPDQANLMGAPDVRRVTTEK